MYGPHHIPSADELMQMSDRIDHRTAYQILHLAQRRAPYDNWLRAKLIKEMVFQLKEGVLWDELRWYALIDWITTK